MGMEDAFGIDADRVRGGFDGPCCLELVERHADSGGDEFERFGLVVELVRVTTCIDLAKVACDKIATGAPLLVDVQFGSLAHCAERIALSRCVQVADESLDVAACAAAYAPLSCDVLFGGGDAPAACLPRMWMDPAGLRGSPRSIAVAAVTLGSDSAASCASRNHATDVVSLCWGTLYL